MPAAEKPKSRLECKDVIKTLHAHLGRELAKVTGMALAAFPLVMTILAIIEPLRDEGLGGAQVLPLIVITLPLMMSMTLPIAALFAATIVYGRFSHDNELTACKASGISTISVLKPALALGAIVTIVSLVLSSFVIPRMIKLGETVVKADVRSIVYRELQATSGYKLHGQGIIVHADSVNEAENKIRGLVVVHFEDPDNVRVIAAPTALVKFTKNGRKDWVVFQLIRAGMVSGNDFSFIETTADKLTRELPTFLKEEPSWYSWAKLMRTLQDPAENSKIQAKLGEIRQELCHDMMARGIAKVINAGGQYTELKAKQGLFSYQISAPRAAVRKSEKSGKSGTVNLLTSQNGDGRKVEVLVRRRGKPYQRVTANSGSVTAYVSELDDKPFVTIELVDDVSVVSLFGSEADIPQKRPRWTVGQLPVPESLIADAKKIPLREICERAGELTDDENIIAKVTYLKDTAIQQLVGEIRSEMHMRLAYGLSCFLMVAMGAALGLMFRGGQIVTAFALSSIPASLMIIMMLMGKQMVSNRDVPMYLGLMAIWGGVALLLAADAVIYQRLARK